MKETNIENPDIIVKDKRILELDTIVTEVKQSEEWEAVQMNILEIGIAKGKEEGIKEGLLRTLIDLVKNDLLSIKEAAKRAGMSQEEFEKLLK